MGLIFWESEIFLFYLNVAYVKFYLFCVQLIWNKVMKWERLRDQFASWLDFLKNEDYYWSTLIQTFLRIFIGLDLFRFDQIPYFPLCFNTSNQSWTDLLNLIGSGDLNWSDPDIPQNFGLLRRHMMQYFSLDLIFLIRSDQALITWSG